MSKLASELALSQRSASFRASQHVCELLRSVSAIKHMAHEHHPLPSWLDQHQQRELLDLFESFDTLAFDLVGTAEGIQRIMAPSLFPPQKAEEKPAPRRWWQFRGGAS